jgi:hypothetical protein
MLVANRTGRALRTYGDGEINAPRLRAAGASIGA